MSEKVRIRIHRALIDWIPKEDGGRTKPPSGVGPHPYSTVVRIGEEEWPSAESWSLVVRKQEAESSEYRWIADVHFLFEEAPQDSLRPGQTFELYEGAKCVARGQITE
jgi:hypothetical protein